MFTGYESNHQILIQFLLFDLAQIFNLCDQNLTPEEIIALLSGQTFKIYTPFNWSQKEGLISKLKRHAILYRSARMEDLHAEAFLKTVERIWVDAYSTSDINKIMRGLEMLSRCLKKMLIPYQENENVLFFVIRNKEKLTPLFDRGLFKKMLSPQMDDFLYNKYSERGYHHILPLIAQSMHGLYA